MMILIKSRHLALVFLTLLCSQSWAQSTKLDARIVFFSGDTLDSQIKVWVNMFNRDLIRENSFYRKLHIVEGDQVRKVKIKEISSLIFTDTDGTSRKFVSELLLKPLRRTRGILCEENSKGEINWYTIFSTNTYDQSVVRTDYFWRARAKEALTSGAFRNLPRRMAKLLFKDEPDWAGKLNAAKTFDDIKQIIRDYNNGI